MENVVLDLNAIFVNLLLAIITAAVGSVATWASMLIKSKLNGNQLELLEQIAASVVLAVEQSAYGTELVNDGVRKKDAALTLITDYLQKFSITVSPEVLDATIESAVANVLNANKLIEPPKVVDFEGPSQQGDGFLS